MKHGVNLNCGRVYEELPAAVGKGLISVLEAGDFKISVGGSLPGRRSEELGMARHVETLLSVE
jgi:hypothetical protein